MTEMTQMTKQSIKQITTKTYGVLVARGPGAADEEIVEYATLSAAHAAYHQIVRHPADDVVAVQLVELEGVGPMLASDGDVIAPTSAPRRTLSTWTAEVAS